MPWSKLDDKAYRHRKQLAAGEAAVGYWSMALSWCSDHGTNGKIGPEDLVSVYPHRHMTWAKAKGYADRLCKVGLFERVKDEHGQTIPDTYLVHDYLDYNPSAQEAAETREARAVAGAEGGRKSGETRRRRRKQTGSTGGSNDGSSGEANGEANASVDDEANREANEEAKANPVPVPVPESPRDATRLSGALSQSGSSPPASRGLADGRPLGGEARASPEGEAGVEKPVPIEFVRSDLDALWGANWREEADRLDRKRGAALSDHLDRELLGKTRGVA
jgi:hypothetical protein